MEQTESKTNTDEAIKTNAHSLDEFVRIGRTGRRNAVADVNLDPNNCVSASNLSDLLQKLNANPDEDNSQNKS